MLENTLLEIHQIPSQARECYQKNKNVRLPKGVPYLGMGASFNALIAPFYSGADFYPYLASEYYHYLFRKNIKPLGVIISQSGKSKEALLSRSCFDKYIAITNSQDSPLAKGKNRKDVILLSAGEETSISSKTYLNTLIVLYQGFGFDVRRALTILNRSFAGYEKWGEQSAEQIYAFLKTHPWRGFHIIGSGPNLASAMQAAITMSETTKLGINGMSLAQYDHGPKETIHNSIIIFIDTKGETAISTRKMITEMQSFSDCLIIRLEIKDVEEIFSPFLTIVPLNFLTYYLAGKLGVSRVYQIGDKVIES